MWGYADHKTVVSNPHKALISDIRGKTIWEPVSETNTFSLDVGDCSDAYLPPRPLGATDGDVKGTVPCCGLMAQITPMLVCGVSITWVNKKKNIYYLNFSKCPKMSQSTENMLCLFSTWTTERCSGNSNDNLLSCA